MRILVHDYAGYSFCLELSREIAARGHEVQHVFFPAACPSLHNMERRDSDPATLEILPLGSDLSYNRYASLARRRAQEIAYGDRLSQHIAAWRPAVILSANSPLDVQRRASRASRAVGARFVYWLHDILSIAMRVILQQRLRPFGPLGLLVARYYGAIERDVARRSDAVIAITDDFLPLLARWGVALERCHLIENWAPKDDIRPLPKDNVWSRAHRLHDKKVFLYAGRLGMKQKPSLLLELARSYRTDKDAVVLVIADGQGIDWLGEMKTREGLDNLLLLPFQPYHDLPNVLATGDVLVCIIEETAHLYSVPSKILSYLAAGRPVLAAMPTDNTNARHITRIQAGLVVSPDDPAEFLATARRMMDDPDRLASYQRNARRYAEEAFDIKRITDRFLAIMAG